MSEPDPLVGSALGPYRLESRIGAGATGAVYRATRPDRADPVALKILDTALGSIGALEGRYRREARVLNKLSHPNIVEILDFGVDQGRTYIAMELLLGQTLEERLNEAPFELDRVLPLFVSVLEALAMAHARDIVHRDLKPANVFLHDDGRIVLLDFGLSKVLSVDAVEGEAEDEELTRRGRIVGTPGYMAPEQITGAFIDVRADVYALGIMLYELLADRRPFTEERRPALLRAHLLEPPPDPAEVRPTLWLAPELQALIERALAKDAAERFQDAAEMLEALRALPEEAVRLQEVASMPETRRRVSASSEVITADERRAAIEAATTGDAAASKPEPSEPPVAEPPSRRVPTWLWVSLLALLLLLAVGLGAGLQLLR